MNEYYNTCFYDIQEHPEENHVLSILTDNNPIAAILDIIISGACFMTLFRKCGLKWWQAWIPCIKSYCVGLCAHREKEGRILFLLEAFIYIMAVLTLYPLPDTVLAVLALITMVLVIIEIIQVIRVYSGLCEVFKRKKTWILSWLLFSSLTALIWGLSSKFTPSAAATDKDKEADISGIEADKEAEGLTVNIEKRTAHQAFSTNTLLKDIHMIIPKGHMVLLLGGSGAGKTTYLNAVTGYEKADAIITLDSINIYKEYDQIKYELGFVPQQELMRGNDTVIKTLTDAANIRLPASMSHEEKKQRVMDVLESFGLSMLQNTAVEKLSGGQKKRLSISIEYISDPSLFILDEPDSGLDGVVARSLFEKLREIADQGKIVIVITHTPDRVIDLFDDVIVLAKDSSRTGRLAYYGPVDTARRYFARGNMEAILRTINQKEEGGEGRADEYVSSYSRVARLVDEGKTFDDAVDEVLASKNKEAANE